MAVLKERIGHRSKGPMSENDHWWRLCYDTDTRQFYVEHEWDCLHISNLQPYAGSESHDADNWRGEGFQEMPSAKERLLERAKRGDVT